MKFSDGNPNFRGYLISWFYATPQNSQKLDASEKLVFYSIVTLAWNLLLN